MLGLKACAITIRPNCVCQVGELYGILNTIISHVSQYNMFWKVCNGDIGCSIVFLQRLLMGYIQQLSRALEPQATLGPLIPNYMDSNTYTEKLKFQQRFVWPRKANWVTMPSTLGVTFRGDGALLELSWPRKSLLENEEEWEHPRGLQWRIPGLGSANVKNQSCRRGCSIQSTGNPAGTELVAGEMVRGLEES